MPWPPPRGGVRRHIGGSREEHSAAAALVGEERGESDEEDVDIEDEKTQGLFLHIFMLLEGLWT